MLLHLLPVVTRCYAHTLFAFTFDCRYTRSHIRYVYLYVVLRTRYPFDWFGLPRCYVALRLRLRLFVPVAAFVAPAFTFRLRSFVPVAFTRYPFTLRYTFTFYGLFYGYARWVLPVGYTAFTFAHTD